MSFFEGTFPPADGPSAPAGASGWACDSCTLHNPNTAARCEACGSPGRGRCRPQQQPAAAVGGWWVCPVCTLSNRDSAHHCGACALQRDVPLPAGEWACQRCSMRNPTRMALCSICDEPRSAAVARTVHQSKSSDISAEARTLSAKTQHSPDELATALRQYIDGTGSTVAEASAALSRYGFSVGKAMSAFLSQGDCPMIPYRENEEMLECRVCYTEAEPGEAVLLVGCGHAFCKSCVNHQIKARLSEGDVQIKCLEAGCPGRLTETEVQNIAGWEVLAKVLERSVMRAVDTSAALQQCRTPDCRYVVELVDGMDPRLVCPLCSKDHCLACGTLPYHFGLTCQQHQAKVVDDAERERSLEHMRQAQIKVCPSCGNGVLRSVGCDHMTCRCGHSFNYSDKSLVVQQLK